MFKKLYLPSLFRFAFSTWAIAPGFAGVITALSMNLDGGGRASPPGVGAIVITVLVLLFLWLYVLAAPIVAVYALLIRYLAGQGSLNTLTAALSAIAIVVAGVTSGVSLLFYGHAAEMFSNPSGLVHGLLGGGSIGLAVAWVYCRLRGQVKAAPKPNPYGVHPSE